MKYTIELTNNQKAQMDCMIDIVHRYVGFNPKLEPIEASWESKLDENRKQAYDRGYEVGYNEGLTKQSDPHFVPLQKCPVKLEDCKAYKLGIEDLSHAIKVYYPLNSRERLDYFGTSVQVETYAVGNPKNLIARAKYYEEKKKKEIKVGDIVKFNEKCHNYDHVKSREYLVLHIFDNGVVTILYDNGDTGAAEISLLDKTGRHIDEVEQLLDKLRGEEKQ